MRECRKWTDEEISLIMAKAHSDEELARMLNRSIDAIRARRYMIRKPPPPPKPPKERKYPNGICNETCPDYCPYKDCRMSGAKILSAEYHRKKARAS